MREYTRKLFVCIFLLFLVCLLFGTVHAQEENSAEQEQLLNKIEELENRLNELTEESRARRKLEITEQEKEEKEKEVLEAVSREYTLDTKHTVNLDYSLNYSYAPSESINTLELEANRIADHTVRHTISTSYSVLNNLSVSTSIPFVYRYKDRGTEDELNESDIGDISLGVSFQPFKSEVGQLRTTVSSSVSLPTGRSPYKINPETEISTGSGTYGFSLSANFSKQVDPIVIFWNVGYDNSMDLEDLDYVLQESYMLEKVETGETFRFGGGFGYALSYKVSINFSFSYSYTFGSKYFYRGASAAVKSGDSISASTGIGMGWKVSPKTTLSYSVGYGLTGSGFSVTFRMPFTFIL